MNMCPTPRAAAVKDLGRMVASQNNANASANQARDGKASRVRTDAAPAAIATRLRNEAGRRAKKVSVSAKKREQRKRPTRNLARNNARKSSLKKPYRLPNPNRMRLGSRAAEVAAAVEVAVGAVEVEVHLLIRDVKGLCLRLIVIGLKVVQGQGRSPNLAADQDLPRAALGPKASHVRKAVRGPKDDLGLRVGQGQKAVQGRRVGPVQRADLAPRVAPDPKVFQDLDLGQRVDLVRNPKAYQGLDPVRDLKADLAADQVLAPDLARPDLVPAPVPDLDPVPEILDQTRQFLENPFPLVKTKLRLGCKYLTLDFNFNFLYLQGKSKILFQFCS